MLTIDQMKAKYEAMTYEEKLDALTSNMREVKEFSPELYEYLSELKRVDEGLKRREKLRNRRIRWAREGIKGGLRWLDRKRRDRLKQQQRRSVTVASVVKPSGDPPRMAAASAGLGGGAPLTS